jgi:biotin carboxyl carrier protein
MKFESKIDGKVFNITIDQNESAAFVNDTEISYQIIRRENEQILFRTGTKVYKVDNISIENQLVTFTINGIWIEATVKDEQELLLEQLGFTSSAKSAAASLKAPMPGKILDILISPGDEITAGQPVLILEAMKMENELKAASDGIVDAMHVKKGDNVEKNQTLLEITPRG